VPPATTNDTCAAANARPPPALPLALTRPTRSQVKDGLHAINKDKSQRVGPFDAGRLIFLTNSVSQADRCVCPSPAAAAATACAVPPPPQCTGARAATDVF
jgi:hypothetical protein